MKEYWQNDYCTGLLEKIRNGRCALLGFGVTGRAIIEFLFDIGAEKITVHDRKTAEELDAADYVAKGISFVSGEQYLDDIEADFIFRSPGIRDDHEGIVRAVANGAYLTSEMELFFELTPAIIIGITGSDGKTTTTTLCAKILEQKVGDNGHVYLGGNIGTPLLPRVFEMTENDYAVVELSSFQLKTMKQSADVSIITNLSPNHLDWHTGMDEYIESKFNICCHRGKPWLVTNADNELTMKLVERVYGATLFSSTRSSYEEICEEGSRNRAIFERDGEIILSDGTIERVMLKTSDIKLVGRHNVENYMAAIGALEKLVSTDHIRAVARTFGGVEHRLEFVRTLNGVNYYNSSIDTSPTRTAAALSALERKPIVICGGYDKHIPFDTLGDTLCQRAKAVVLTGATAKAIKAAIDASAFRADSELVVLEEANFECAVLWARELAKEGDIVILSPACASFDAFPNFAARGNKFKQIVNEMQ